MERAVDRVDGMAATEVDVLTSLVKQFGAREILEIGMANGSSTVALLRSHPDVTVTSIDPGQTSHYRGAGMEHVRQSGFSARHTLIEHPDYVALPDLVRLNRQFDFAFIDGYHALDYAMIDAFYCDLLLRVGGILAFHDAVWTSVFPVCEFMRTEKAYEPLGPDLMTVETRVWKRAWRRLRYAASGRWSVFHDRSQRWRSLAAFRKKADRMSDQVASPGQRISASAP